MAGRNRQSVTPGSPWGGTSWRRALVRILASWNRNQFRWILAAILGVWLLGGTGLYLAEGDGAFATWGGSLWNVWMYMFSGVEAEPATAAGRWLTVGIVVSGVALAGLFTASVASFLVEQLLRSREVKSVEMSGHLVLCNWSSRGLEWVREVHSKIIQSKRPVVVIHDNPDDVELPDRQDDPAFDDVYIIKGDPVNEVVLRRARVPQAHSVVVLSDDRQGAHADGKTILCCIAVRSVCRGEERPDGERPNVVAECRDPAFRLHIRRAGADEVISSTHFGVRLLARAALYHGMTRVYQELLTVGRSANEVYLMPIPAEFVGRPFVEVAEMFLRFRGDRRACLVIGVQREEAMMLNPTGEEAGPLREGDELILLSQVQPNPAEPLPTEPVVVPRADEPGAEGAREGR